MNRFYFTFGSSEQYPYQGGWVEVVADNIYEAIQKYKAKYPCIHEGIINCADYYTEEEFMETSIWVSDNMGKRCHEVIE